MKLIKLPDGTWVNPDRVRKVEATMRFEGYLSGEPRRSPPTVCVWIDGETSPICYDFQTLEIAQAARDRIAALVNGEAEER